jgi:hypothetical protein
MKDEYLFSDERGVCSCPLIKGDECEPPEKEE